MKKLFLPLGILALIIAWLGPLPNLAHETFFAHMIMHMLVVAIAAPLLSLWISTRVDLAQKYPYLFLAIPASIGELIIVWGWHAPGLHHYARHTSAGLFLEQGSFLLAGLWVWVSCLSPSQRGGGIIGLLLTSMHMTLLGALLGLAPRSLYPHHQGFGSWSALQDQQLGGAIMLVIGGIVYLWGGLWVSSHLLDEKNMEIAEAT